MVRSSHPLEGRNGLSWSGVFESVARVYPDAENVYSAYINIITSDFKPLRYAMRHNVADFSMGSMDVILMPQIFYDYHVMIRSSSKERDGLIQARIELRSGLRGYFFEGNFDDLKKEEWLKKPLEVYSQINKVFDNTQEVELCVKDEYVWVLQSRDFTEKRPLKVRDAFNNPLPDEELPIYVIDESSKDLDDIDKELRSFGLKNSEYIVFILDASQTMSANKFNRGSELHTSNLGYTPYLEEARASFLLSPSLRPWSMHYEWKVGNMNACRIHQLYPGDNRHKEFLYSLIKTGKANPKVLFEEIEKYVNRVFL